MTHLGTVEGDQVMIARDKKDRSQKSQRNDILLGAMFIFYTFPELFEHQNFISNSFCENSFNELLDTIAVGTVGMTLADACKVAFLV